MLEELRDRGLIVSTGRGLAARWNARNRVGMYRFDAQIVAGGLHWGLYGALWEPYGGLMGALLGAL